MTNVYFMNLAIDQLWDENKNLENIFSVRVPQSTHLVRINEDYSLLISDHRDLILGYLKPDINWIHFLGLHNVKSGRHIQILANPYDRDLWIDEVSEKLVGLPEILLSSVGVSALEEKLLSRLGVKNLSNTISKQKFIFLNSKKRLLEIAAEKNISVPDSFVESSRKLKTREGFLLKSEFSSGGGGNIDFSDKTSLTDFFLRKIQQGPESDWIWQKKCERKVDWTYFGFTQNEKPIAILEVSYDLHSLSYCHRFAQLADETKDKLEQAWSATREFLIQQKYSGAFGIDAFETVSGEIFSLIDLNVRYTKTHFIWSAAERFGLCHLQWECHRVRRPGQSVSFANWWKKVRSEFHLDERGFDESGRFIIPIQVGGLQAISTNGPIEVTYLCGKTSGEFTQWCKKVYKFIHDESFDL